MRLYRQAPDIEVDTDDKGQPLVVRWRGRAYWGRVGANWRIETGWWEGEAVERDYYLFHAPGLDCQVYKDLVAGGWHLQVLYD